MLSEAQIQRFSRQILLREVGGVGQERLLVTPVRVTGQSAAFEVARRTLLAGGSPLSDVALLVIGEKGPHADVVIFGSTVAAGCRACLAELTSTPSPQRPELAVMLGSLAALTAQRLVLGRGEAVVVARWADGRLETSHPKCPHSP